MPVFELTSTASHQNRLSHINALHINEFYWPKDEFVFWKTQFFWFGYFGILFFKKNAFCFIPMKIGQIFFGIKDGSKFWWLPWFPIISAPSVGNLNKKDLEIDLKCANYNFGTLLRGLTIDSIVQNFFFFFQRH